MEYYTQWGYAGLFLASFSAATVLPLSSELVLGFLLLNGFNPIISIGVATGGNVLGSFLNYALGFWGSLFLVKKVSRISENAFFKAKQRFRKYGVYSLFFAWAPVIGDPLTVVAGVLRVNIGVFFLLVASGKLIRYILVSYVILHRPP